MRIRVAVLIFLAWSGLAGAQPAPNPTPPPANAPPGQEAEQPNYEMTPMEGGQLEAPPEVPAVDQGQGPGPQNSDLPTGPPDASMVPNAAGTAPAAATTPTTAEASTSDLANAATTAIQTEYPSLTTHVSLAVTSEGILEVSGVVPKLGDKLNIHETLTDLPQSAMVVNRIRVEPPRRADTAIERDVRKALHSDNLLRTFKIDAETRNQKVYLSGTVPTPMMEQAALRTASEVRGVRDVIVSQLRIH